MNENDLTGFSQISQLALLPAICITAKDGENFPLTWAINPYLCRL